MLNKKEKARKWLEKYSQVSLRCIYCHEKLQFTPYLLRCRHGHSFDLSKQGYAFLSKKPSDSYYQRDLFEVRRQIIAHSSFYEKLHANIIHYLSDLSCPVILEAGSGEGSHLFKIGQAIHHGICMGIDLSKDGIIMSTDYNDHQLSMVADLSEIPLLDQQCDVILSILSPSNYEEFNRVLKPNGIILKVIPNEGYLQEIREIMRQHGWISSDNYDNHLVIESFLRHYPQAEIQTVKESVYVSQETLHQLIRMTPLTWHLTDDQLQQLQQSMPSNITLDMSILIHQQSITE